MFDIFRNFGEVFSLSICLDFFSITFCRVVRLITGVVLSYSIFYIGNLPSKRFLILLLLFVISMIFLIFSMRFFFIMLGWDGLGIISFALVLYYNNEISLKSSLLTLFINRLGDSAILFFICLMLLSSYDYNMLFLEGSLLPYFLLVLGCFTKSAQFPFISWLPAAITAPTPISSLVHSSTLVTAGVYLLLRINVVFFEEFLVELAKILGIFTMLIGGILAVIEFDFKRIVAYSTLSQLGLIVFVLRFGEVYLSFFQLITHAIFKSFLFMMSGIIISISYGNQDRRLMGLNLNGNFIYRMFIGFTCLNLRGFPIMMGFFSKDLIVESLFSYGMESLIIILFFVACLFTVCYRVKIYFRSVFFIGFGSSVSYRLDFLTSLKFLLFLFVFMSSWGIIMEEFVALDFLYSFEQDLKILDFSILLFGIVLFFLTKNFKFIIFLNLLLDFVSFNRIFYYFNLFFVNIFNCINIVFSYLVDSIFFNTWTDRFYYTYYVGTNNNRVNFPVVYFFVFIVFIFMSFFFVFIYY